MAETQFLALERIPFAALSSRKVSGSILGNLNAISLEIIKEFESTVQTWENKVSFVRQTGAKKFQFRGGNVMVIIEPVADGGEGYERWVDLTSGYWRWDKMHPEFVRKTHPGTIPSVEGNQPDPIVVGRWKEAQWVEPREWVEQIEEKKLPEFYARMDKATAAQYE